MANSFCVAAGMTAEGPRRAFALLLGRAAYVLFYLTVAALVLGVPAGLGYLAWSWLSG